jgi:hypothetical protein
MSRPVSSPHTVQINRDQAIDQETLNKVKAFKNSLDPNDRVLVKNSGNTTIYTQQRESVSEKFTRKLDNFEKNVKAAWSHVGDLFSVKNKGNRSEATKNVKNTPTHKSLPPESNSISVKKFNSRITNFTNTIPVFVGLQNDHTKAGLSALEAEIKQVKNLDRALSFFATGPRSLEKVQNEFSAFLAFAKAQATRDTIEDKNRGAIDFANRWMAVSVNSKDELIDHFGEKAYGTISAAALQLAVYCKE